LACLPPSNAGSGPDTVGVPVNSTQQATSRAITQPRARAIARGSRSSERDVGPTVHPSLLGITIVLVACAAGAPCPSGEHA
jgi:hypothetical protein